MKEARHNVKSIFIVGIPLLKKQYRTVLNAQQRPGTTKKNWTLLEGVLNFFDDVITASEHDRLNLVIADAGMENKKLFLLQILDDIEPVLHGPYASENERLAAAKKFRFERGMRDGFFMIDCNAGAELSCFGAGELEES